MLGSLDEPSGQIGSARLAALVVRWHDLRWEKDSEIYEALEAWRKQDKHLWTWQENQREKSLRRRRDAYRVAAHELAGRFGTLVLEDFDLTVHARRPKVEEEDKDERGQILRRQKAIAAAGELRLALVNAFVSTGGKVVKLNPADTTKICWLCGAKDAWDQAAEDAVERVCTECGALVDQDENACRMLLARYCEQLGDEETETEENQGFVGRWQRRKETRSQKQAAAQGQQG
jgi:transposase